MGTDESDRNRLEALATTLGSQADRIDRLEAELGLDDDGERVDVGDALATLVDAQADRIDRLEAELGLDDDPTDRRTVDADAIENRSRPANAAGQRAGVEAPENEHPRMSRRTLVKLAGLTGLLGYGTGTVAADPVGKVGSEAKPLRAAYTQRIGGGVVDNQVVTSLLGAGLSVEDESLSAAGAAADHVDVADGDETVVEDAAKLAFADNLSVSESESDDGTVTVDSTNPSVEEQYNSVADDVSTFKFEDNLSVSDQGNGTVAIEGSTGSNTHTDVSDSGTTTVSDTEGINFGTKLAVTDDGDGSATVDAVNTAAWVDDDNDDLLEPADGAKTGIEKMQTVAGDGSVSVDIDHDDDATGETFTVTHNGGTPLLTVNDSGEVDLNAGALDTNGNDVTNSSGDVTLGSALDTSGNAVTDSTGDLRLSPSGNVALSGTNLDAGGNSLNNVASVDNGGSSISVDDALDVQSGTVTNSSGSLAVQTGGSNNDLSLSPSGSISAAAAIQADNGITTSSGKLSLDAASTINAGSAIEADNGITTSSGDLTLSPSGTVALSSANLDASGNTLSNVASVDNGGSAISVDDDLDASGNAVTTDKLNSADISSNAAADKVMTTDGSGNLSLNDAVVGKSANYEIQKDGSDTSGVINFKTV